MKKILAGIVLVGLGIAAAGSAFGEPPDGPPPGRPRGPRGDGPPHGPPGHPVMAALDADQDGSLSADEIAGAADALKQLDKNDDGTLSEDELRPPRDRGPRGDGPPEFGRRVRDGDRPDGPPQGRGPRRGGGPDDFRRGPQGRGPRGFGPPDGDAARGPHVLPPGALEHLGLSEAQVEEIHALEIEVKTKVEEILEPEQLERLGHMARRGPGGFGGRGEGPPGPRRGRPPRDE